MVGKISKVNPNSLVVDVRLKALVPRPKASERAAMLVSIQEHGVREPLRIRLCDSVIIDGHTRQELALEAKLDSVPVIFDDIPQSLNLNLMIIESAIQRRNLSKWDRVKIAPAYIEASKQKAIIRIKNGRKQVAPDESGSVRDIVAAKLGVGSGKLLEMGLKLLKTAPPDILAELDNENMTISAAYTKVFKKASTEMTAEVFLLQLQSLINNHLPSFIEDIRQNGGSARKAVEILNDAISELNGI